MTLVWVILYFIVGFFMGTLCFRIPQDIKELCTSQKGELKIGFYLLFLCWALIFFSCFSTYQATNTVQKQIDELKNEVCAMKTDAHLIEKEVDNLKDGVVRDTLFIHIH